MIQILSKQTIDTYQWLHKLIDTIQDNKWDDIPEVLASNISWQVGHIVISIYYHTILVIKGHQPDVLEQVPLRTYSELFTFNGTPKKCIGGLTPEELKNHLQIIEKKSIEIIDSLTFEDIEDTLIPGEVEHPVATTKFEAIDWNIKHTMWHCGQIASIKRVLGNPYTFTLKKT